MHIEAFRAVFPNLEYITSNDSFFGSVKEEYPEYLKSGFFSKAPEPAIYIYQIKTPVKTYTGLVGCLNIEDFKEGDTKKVYGHEEVIAAKQQRQIELLLKRKAIVKPILLTYQPNKEIIALQEEVIKHKTPDFDLLFEAQQSHHMIWAISDTEWIKLFKAQFQNVERTYIADGHHRSLSSLRLFEHSKTAALQQKYKHIMTALFPSDQIEILDFNRIVLLRQEISPSYLIARLSSLCDIEVLDKPKKPQQKFEFTLILGNEYYKLTWKASTLDQFAVKDEVILDCALLDDLIFKNILKIEDVNNHPDVTYIEGPKGIEGLVNKVTKNLPAVGFCLFPVQMEEVIAVANKNKYLPAKSTWFEPRMKNGLIVYDL